MFSRIYLDTNIFISAMGGDGEKGHDQEILLLDMIGAIRPSGMTYFVTSELSLAEAIVHPLRARDDETVQGFDNLLTSGGWLTVNPVSRQILLGSSILRSRYSHLKVPDAIHVATAIAENCTHIMTADKRLRGDYALDYSSPGISIGAGTAEIIRPDAATLNRIISWLETL